MIAIWLFLLILRTLFLIPNKFVFSPIQLIYNLFYYSLLINPIITFFSQITKVYAGTLLSDTLQFYI